MAGPIVPRKPILSDEKPPLFKLILPPNLREEERKRLEAEAREYERRCWVETGAPPKWDLLLRADPEFAAAVRAEADRIYNQAIAELTARRAREAELERRIAAELRQEARLRAAQAAVASTPQLLEKVLILASRHLSKQGDDATLRSLAQSFRLANQIATTFRWPLIWDKATVAGSLRTRVLNLRDGAKGQIATSREAILKALDELIDIICDPEVSPEDTRRALDHFLRTHTTGFPPPKDLMTKALEFTSAKSLWLKRYRLFYPGEDSTQHGQKIPDFVSPFGPGDNVRASGFNRQAGGGVIEPVLNPDHTSEGALKSMDAAYNSVLNDLRAKVGKYKGLGKVVVTVDATTAPWMNPAEIRRRISIAMLGANLDAVYLLKGGRVERVWP